MTPLPYPALHATHGGIWLAWPDGRTETLGARRGDRAGGRDADDHAERAAGRAAARLSRAERARPARAVRLRPSGALRRADAAGHRPRARPRRAGRRRCGGRLPARGGGGAAGDARRPTGPSARAPGPRRRRSPGCAGPGRRPSPSGCRGPSATSAGSSRACPNGRRKAAARRRARSGSRCRRRRRDRLERLVGDGAEARQGQRDYAAAATAVFAPRAAGGPAQPPARRSRHRDRQDPGLSRPRLALGRAGGRRGLGLDLHQGAAAPARPRGRRGSSPTRPSGRRRIVVRKGRENYLCLLNLEDALQGGFAGRAAILAQLVARWAAYSKDGDMVGGDLPGWLTEPVPPRRRHRADRPARRMRLCRLPALPPLLHRARRPRQPGGRPRHRQPCAGDGQRGARPRTAASRRPGSCSTRAIICSTPPIRPSPPRLTGQEAIELRRWIVGPGGPRARPAARARGAADGRRLL